MKNFTAHVVSTTHWDREWYKPFQSFRMRLVEMIDNLLDLMESNPDYRYFTFDGQVVVIDDYLAIRPENESRLRSLVEDGRIILGPFYNQPDEFIVSGESLIRNLLLGLRICKHYGSYLQAGYVPDCFGHISQLPQILQGFGIDTAIFFRGITQDQTASQFVWKSPSGSSVLAFKLPDERAYSDFFYALIDVLRDDANPVDADKAVSCLQTLLDESIQLGATTTQLLFLDGVDHVFAQPKTPEIIETGNNRIENLTLIHSTIDQFIEAYKKEQPELKTITGELRHSNRDWTFQAILAHVMSSRINIKQANYKCEVMLEKYAEPLSTWAWWLGREYPKSYMDLSWQYLLLNSPHDSVCGCSVDQVHRDMMYRYDQSRIISENLIKQSIEYICSLIATPANNAENRYWCTVFNTILIDRSETVEAEVYVPGNASIASVRVLDSNGEEIPSHLLSIDRPANLIQLPHDIPRDHGHQRIKVVFRANNVPGIGYKTYCIETSNRPNRQPKTLLTGPYCAENEYIRLKINHDGTLSLTDKDTGQTYTDLMAFEDGADIGDGYNYRTPIKDSIFYSTGMSHRISVEENNAVRVVFRISTDFILPKTISVDMTMRSDETTVCNLETYVTLSAGIKRVDIKTVLTNDAKYHRLRVLFPTRLACTKSFAEQAFDVVERDINIPLCKDWKEAMPATQPQKSFVDISDGNRALAIINKGLQEYEVSENPDRAIALTLIRCNYGWPGESGPDRDAQLPGEHCFEYAIYPHSGDWESGMVYKQAHSYNMPFAFGQCRSDKGILPLLHSFIKSSADSFILSALKKAENCDGLILRGYNISNSAIDCDIDVQSWSSAERVDLKEDKSGKISCDGKSIELNISPKSIETILISK